MMIKRSYSFTLVETLLSLGLVAFIVCFFFAELSKHLRLKNQIAVVKEKVIPTHELQERLNQLFSKIESSSKEARHLDIAKLYTSSLENSTEPTSLTFFIQLGIDPDPVFRHLVSCVLYVKEDGTLMLDMTPLSPLNQSFLTNKTRSTVLLSHVKKMKLSFYDEIQDKQAVTSKTTLLKKSLWDPSEGDLPAFIHLELTLKEASPLELSFQIRSKLNPITYRS